MNGRRKPIQPVVEIAMNQYTCPKCKTILKRQEAVPAGKKIKCPKCANIFAPAGAVAGRAVDDDVPDTNPYAVRTDDEESDTVREEKQRAAMGLIKDRFKKSKRGPCQAKVVVPANLMTASGVIMGILYVILFIVGIFPMVFREYYLDTPTFKAMTPEQLRVKWEQIVTIRIIIMVGAAIGFIVAGFVCVGAFKMRTIESYGWAMTGAIILTLLGGIFGLVGIYCIITLRDKAVIDGFAEEQPPEALTGFS
jgi:DNA-directed RNA polymerase subunit RPC12/RpoP